LDQIDDENHHCDHEQDVNEAPERIGTDKAQKPEHEQNHKYSPEHIFSLVEFRFLFFSFPGRAVRLLISQF
jgi:hypothetical protein